MFSLVTALVSPHAIEALHGKRETLVSTLKENANVMCFQPNDGLCLLQGEWENVKKAYAILEEFYFRAQAEIMVREMLKGSATEAAAEIPQPRKDAGAVSVANWSNSFLSSLFPLVDHQSEDLSFRNAAKEMTDEKPRTWLSAHGRTTNVFSKTGVRNHNKIGNKDDNCRRSNDAGYVVDTTTVSSEGQRSNHNEEDDDEVEDDEDPPILMKEDPCCADVISLTSELSNPKDMDFYSASGIQIEYHEYTSSQNQATKTLPNRSEVTKLNATQRESWQLENTQPAEEDIHGEPPQLTDNHLYNDKAAEKLKAAERKDGFKDQHLRATRSQQRCIVSNPSSSDDGLELTHEIGTAAAAFHTQQYLNSSMSGCKLPQFSSLLLGSPTLAQGIPTWQYADLYGMHLSALQSMHIKREPSSSLISSSDLTAPVLAPRCDDDFGNDLGYKFDDDAQFQEMHCTRCNKTYRSEARMKEHVRTHDKDYVPVLHSCPKCSKSFTYRHNMVVHLRRFHYGWQPAKRHACRICGIRFQKPYLLRLHERKAHVL